MSVLFVCAYPSFGMDVIVSSESNIHFQHWILSGHSIVHLCPDRRKQAGDLHGG